MVKVLRQPIESTLASGIGMVDQAAGGEGGIGAPADEQRLVER